VGKIIDDIPRWEPHPPIQGGFITTKFNELLGWARKFSLFHYPFVTACCGMEYMSAACAHFDIDRFGAGWTRFSPRQSDMLLVVGTVTQKLAPVLRTVYNQMTNPKWVVAFGACAVSELTASSRSISIFPGVHHDQRRCLMP